MRFYKANQPTISLVSRAITSSSLVGITKTLTLESGGGDHYILAALGVCLIVDFYAEVSEVLGYCRTGSLAVLADAGSEDDGVNAVHCGDVGTGDLGDPVMEHIQSQSARSLPFSAALSRSRKSEDTPETPSTPDFLFRMFSISSML